MTNTFKQVLALVKHLSYEENEALRSVLFDINYQTKKDMELAIKQELSQPA